MECTHPSKVLRRDQPGTGPSDTLMEALAPHFRSNHICESCEKLAAQNRFGFGYSQRPEVRRRATRRRRRSAPSGDERPINGPDNGCEDPEMERIACCARRNHGFR
jgi:hypothetical protein